MFDFCIIDVKSLKSHLLMVLICIFHYTFSKAYSVSEVSETCFDILCDVWMRTNAILVLLITV